MSKEKWEVRKLGEVIVYDKKQKVHTELPYIGLEHIESNSGKLVADVSEKDVKSSTFYFDNQHILYGRLRPYLNKVFLPNFVGHCSTEIFPIRVHKELIRKFLFYWFIKESTVDKINKTSTGARMPRANMNQLLDFDFSLPPLPEQQRIVFLLDQAFEAIDKAKANAEKNLENAKELFESYLQSVFETKGKGWEEKKLNEIAENLDSKRIPIAKNKREKGDIPYYGASGVVDYVKDFIFDEDLLCISEDGANLLARTYPIAFSISGKTWVNNHAHVLRFKNFVTQRFVEYYINSIRINDYVSGMAQPKLNQRMLNTIPIPVASLNKQKQIVEKFDLLQYEVIKLESLYQSKLENLEELRKSILEKAFNQKL